MVTTITCQYSGQYSGTCTAQATHDVDGVEYCGMHATGLVHRATSVIRIAPNPAPAVADSRPGCHFCGQPVGPRGCEECV